MKKYLILLIIILVAISFLGGCSDDESDVDVYDIEERFFSTQIDFIMRNADEYVGRTVRFEGMFHSFYLAEFGGAYHEVTRRVWGCCGEDGLVGFLVDIGDFTPLDDNAWVEVVGVFEIFEVETIPFLRVVAQSLTEMDERGLEVVTR